VAAKLFERIGFQRSQTVTDCTHLISLTGPDAPAEDRYRTSALWRNPPRSA
jgi:hypothetical protein